MPTFIVIGQGVHTDARFSLNDLSGSTGRLDVLLRCINSAFMLSNDIRRDVDLYLVLLGPPDPPRAIWLRGSELRYLNPDERSTGALIKNALMKRPGKEWQKSTPGIYTARKDLGGILDSLEGRIVYLRESGTPLADARLRKGDIFVLGGREDLTPDQEELLKARPDTLTVSLGPNSLHADHCITVVVNWVDNLAT